MTIINRVIYASDMPKGLKTTSSQIVISGSLNESGANTFTQSENDLQLNVLDREVFVVTAIDMNAFPPDAAAATNSQTAASLSSTSRTDIGTIADSNVIGVNVKSIRADAVVAVGFEEMSPDSPTGSDLDYIGIIATNNFFVQVVGTGNTNARGVHFRLYGYRAVADAATFAALTQSELLSA